MRLAAETYPAPGSLRDGPDLLSLAWTSDEQSALDIDVSRFIQDLLQAEVACGLPRISSYPLWDAHAEAALAPHVTKFFRLTQPAPAVLAGAGVGPLLAAFAAESRSGPVRVIGTTYPDFPAWVERLGGVFAPHDPHAGIGAQIRRAGRDRPAIIFMERPQLFDADDLSTDDVAAICRAVPEALVLVDESNANYCPPEYSLVPRVAELSNLAVLRGFSKAYQLGGLRIGYCVASAEVGARVRRLVPPLQASPLSVGIGGALLELGDIGERFRRTVADARSRAEELFRAAGLPPDREAMRALPYVLYDIDNAEALRALEVRGIRGKQHMCWRAGGLSSVYRLSVPLAKARSTELASRLSTATDPVPRA